MFYGAAVWDPTLIIAQIVTLQCLFYLSLGLWQTILLGPTHGQLTVNFVFGWQHLTWANLDGWISISTNLLSSAVAAFLFVWIVERAKKCLDFAVTLYIIHFVMCWSYSGFPFSLSWWLTNVVGLLLLAFLSEVLCLRREMADIPVASAEPPELGYLSEGLLLAYQSTRACCSSALKLTSTASRHGQLMTPFGVVFSKALRRYITKPRR